MKKILLSVFGVSMVAAAVFAQEEAESVFSFTNKAGTDIVEITKEADGTSAAFGGLYNQMTAELASEKVDAMIQARVATANNGDGIPDGLTFSSDDFDWAMTFRPLEQIGLSLHTGIFAPGSYFAVEDDNAKGGNIGSDGFTFSFTGVPGLTAALTVPFGFDNEDDGVNRFTAKDDEGNSKFAFRTGLGAYYEYESLFTAGASLFDIGLESFGLGVYASVSPLEGLSIYAGYTYNESENLFDLALGKHALNFSAGYETGAFSAGLDYNTGFAYGDDAKMFYSGISFGYSFTDAVAASLGATVKADYGNIGDGEFKIEPAVTLGLGEMGELEAGAEIIIAEKNFSSLKFPVAWTYSF